MTLRTDIDYVYDPSNWTTTQQWVDRNRLVLDAIDGQIKEIHTLREGPKIWAVRINGVVEWAYSYEDARVISAKANR